MTGKNDIYRNTGGEGCIATEILDDGSIVYFFQNEHDIDLLLRRLLAKQLIEESELSIRRERFLTSACFRSGSGCVGNCTSHLRIMPRVRLW